MHRRALKPYPPTLLILFGLTALGMGLTGLARNGLYRCARLLTPRRARRLARKQDVAGHAD